MRRAMPWIVGLLGLVLLTGGFAPADAQTAPKFGVFDPQRVSEEAAEGKRIQSRLSAVRDRKQAEILAMETEAQQMQEQLEQQALTLSVERRTDLQLEVQRKLLEIESAKERASRELQLEVAAAEARFNEQLARVLDQFARDEGFLMIFEYAAVAWTSPSVDLTSAIIDRFDAVYPATTE